MFNQDQTTQKVTAPIHMNWLGSPFPSESPSGLIREWNLALPMGPDIGMSLLDIRVGLVAIGGTSPMDGWDVEGDLIEALHDFFLMMLKDGRYGGHPLSIMGTGRDGPELVSRHIRVTAGSCDGIDVSILTQRVGKDGMLVSTEDTTGLAVDDHCGTGSVIPFRPIARRTG